MLIYILASYGLMNLAEKWFGPAGRIVAGLVALVGFFMVFLKNVYRIGDWAAELDRTHKRETYRKIYRITALPDPKNICYDRRAEIKIGDFGWEASPWRKDGLIYLHGLNEKWGLVWIVGFRPDQIEFHCEKPVSQYDWRDFEYEGHAPGAPYQWYPAKPKQLCPFSVPTPMGDVRLQFPI